MRALVRWLGRAGAQRRAGVLGMALLVACLALAARAGGQLPGEKEEPPVPQTPSSQTQAASPSGEEEPVPPGEFSEEESGSDPSPYGGGYSERVRREPPPIPPARPLPFYPSEPPSTGTPGMAITYPPDFVGSAQGYLEIPVGQTATLLVREASKADPRDAKVARVMAREHDRVLIRGLFPGRTLLDVWVGSRQEVYLVRVR